MGEGQELPAGALPGLPPLRVGEIRLAPTGPFFPLSKAADAHRRMESRQNFGKIVLEIV